jgi:hypothetical protein
MESRQFVAFEGTERLAHGPLVEVVTAARAAAARGLAPVLIFDAVTGEPIEVDLRGALSTVLARLSARYPAPEPEPDTPRGRGRPRLGVIAREVTLLPRHWEWLTGQPGGASAALRRLVDAARKASEPADRVRRDREALYRFASVMAGDAPGFEEASRALFAGDRARFEQHTAGWPADVRSQALAMAGSAFEAP